MKVSISSAFGLIVGTLLFLSIACGPGGAGGLPTSGGDTTTGDSAGSDGSGDTGIPPSEGSDDAGDVSGSGEPSDGATDGDGTDSATTDPDDTPGGSADGTVSGVFDPMDGLELMLGGFSASFPSSAIGSETTITANVSPPTSVPGGLPGGVAFSGATLAPVALELASPATVTVPLATSTIASVLPVLTFDSASKLWVGVGGVATVSAGGATASFEIDALGLVGVPDGLATPPSGEPIGSLLTVTNQGQFTSNVISAPDASLFYSSAVGGSLSVNIMAQTEDAQGQIAFQTLSLSALSITGSGNTIVAEVGGSDSFYNTGDFRSPDEPAVGVMMLSFDGTTATLTVYVGTPERVIAGTLTGPG